MHCNRRQRDHLIKFHQISQRQKLLHYKVTRIDRPQDFAGMMKYEISLFQLPDSLAQSIDDQNQYLGPFGNRFKRETESSGCIDGTIM